jgi:hypothetical protein
VSPWLQFVAWHVHLAGFDRSEMLLTIRPAAGEAAEEGLVDITVGEEEREDSAGLAAASRATRRLIRQAFKTARPTLVFPQETRRISRFAHGPAFVARRKRVDFLYPTTNRAPRCCTR